MKNQNGFSLVELLVVIGIVVIVALATISGYPNFKKKLSLQRASQEVVLGIRQAQIYGLGVKEFGGVYPGYGVHFDISSGPANSFVLFADLDGDSEYDNPGEIVETFRLNKGEGSIEELLCDGVACGSDILNIIYLRPYPTVILKDGNGASGYSAAEITIRSPKGDERSAIVSATGQIVAQ